MTVDAFCSRAEKLVGTPYSQIDCIGVVRLSAGIRCQGTNWLWRSYDNSGKYRYLIDRMERPPTEREARPGLLVFRIDWGAIPKGYTDKPNCYHVGIITINKDVIESSSVEGSVIKKPYSLDEWSGCGWLRQIDRPSEYPESETEETVTITHSELTEIISHLQSIYSILHVD